jgi:hypothetical protein
MKAIRTLAGLMTIILLFAGVSRAQEKAKSDEEAGPLKVLKLDVVLSEFDGGTRISNLPYLLRVISGQRREPPTQVRMGVRVPVVTGSSKEGAPSLQYMDVGTNIDCSARTLEDGRFRLSCSVERSSVYSIGQDAKATEWAPGQPALSSAPIVRQFRNSFDLAVRDGQKVQVTIATDPVSGHSLMLDLTATVEK